jgi:carboxypeptidase PM20D1
MIRRVLLASALLAVTIAAALAINTFRHGSQQITVAPATPIPVDRAAVSARLAGAIRFRTISFEGPSAETQAQLLGFRAYLERAFPHLHAALRREVVNDYSLLFTWTGEDPTAKPILLMAHQDVVPVAPGTEKDWHAGPFSGEIRDGFIWGRGSWDDKGNVMAILEAVESLVASGFRPRRTIYLAFGHDEENGGAEGASKIARVLSDRGVHCEFALDEGLLIAEGILPGLRPPAALIGIAEKGSVTLRLTAYATPGHSSMPPTHSAIGALAAAIERVQGAPMPAAIAGVTAKMFDAIAPELTGFNRVAMSNLWLFGPLVRKQLEAGPSTNALIRTTAAVTEIHGGDKDNMLPGEAEALINFRLLPGDTADKVIDHVRSVVRDDQIRIAPAYPADEPSRVSSVNSPSYQLIDRTIRAVFPGTIVAPGLMIAATDSRHMAAVADDIYRFSPVRARGEDLPRFHGTDERMSVSNYLELIRFYGALIQNAAGRD